MLWLRDRFTETSSRCACIGTCSGVICYFVEPPACVMLMSSCFTLSEFASLGIPISLFKTTAIVNKGRLQLTVS